MAEGTTNEEGIYVYTEDDRPALFSTLLNLLGSSVTIVVRGIRNRLREIEENLPAPLAAVRFDATIKSLPSGVLTRLPLLLLNFDESSTVAPTLWEAVTGNGAGAVRFKKSGMYQVSVKIAATVQLSGRVFVNVGDQRFGTSLETEHQTTVGGTLIVTNDDEQFVMNAYHTSGSPREVTIETTIVRLGDFS